MPEMMPEMVIIADCVYGRCQEELEGTLRAIVRLTGCRWIIVSWKRRGYREEEFLHQLSDLGTVKTVWTATVQELICPNHQSAFLWPGDPLYQETMDPSLLSQWSAISGYADDDDGDDHDVPTCRQHHVGVTALEVHPEVVSAAAPAWVPPTALRMLTITARRKRFNLARAHGGALLAAPHAAPSVAPSEQRAAGSGHARPTDAHHTFRRPGPPPAATV
uniref:Uncharacterized protein n=1 Tax=Haptolina ericina TaxID=156174 RepID=A0A7S3AN43_9EUKA|mmetsp:Transcript_27188/g.61452  ORF Transcript_27188/g.61452 Transcript_27188/m.61452 type:complete len:219 (+) Transcript_27188:1-657(+)